MSGSSPLTRGALRVGDIPGCHDGLIPAHAGSTCPWSECLRCCWAHPRSRGEHGFRCDQERCHVGSSPLTRGAHTWHRDRGEPVGLIPAHAGSTYSQRGSGSPPTAHPRSRGEHLTVEFTVRPGEGSSPLTRGAREFWAAWFAGVGLIPAHAGSTDVRLDGRTAPGAHPRSRGEHSTPPPIPVTCTGSSPLTRGALPEMQFIVSRPGAHPRSRGEHPQAPFLRACSEGSSPLTRGAPASAGIATGGARLIPAHAGSTFWASQYGTNMRAHPRSRGEHTPYEPGTFYGAGSSPLTRGARCGFIKCHCSLRLIPAHAGSTGDVAFFASIGGAHPRSRGEHGPRHVPSSRQVGSSPLTRGARHLTSHRHAQHGLIPAHAGSTFIASGIGCGPQAHPRSRGEHRSKTWLPETALGSSPLTRGAPRPSLIRSLVTRLIPAHAGSTSARL